MACYIPSHHVCCQQYTTGNIYGKLKPVHFRKCHTAADEFVADANLLTFNLIKYLMMLVTGLSTG